MVVTPGKSNKKRIKLPETAKDLSVAVWIPKLSGVNNNPTTIRI